MNGILKSHAKQYTIEDFDGKNLKREVNQECFDRLPLSNNQMEQFYKFILNQSSKIEEVEVEQKSEVKPKNYLETPMKKKVTFKEIVCENLTDKTVDDIDELLCLTDEERSCLMRETVKEYVKDKLDPPELKRQKGICSVKDYGLESLVD